MYHNLEQLDIEMVTSILNIIQNTRDLDRSDEIIVIV
jgi:hypothetical protein